MPQLHDIPIFPLPLVLYPGMLQPLHIFEDRYKQMVADLGGVDGEFGIVLAEPCGDDDEQVHTLGTIARITHLEPLCDGRANLICVGTTRFRIHRWQDGAPYARAHVEFLVESEGDTALAATVNDDLGHYLDALFGLMNMAAPDLPEPESPVALSYLAAAALQVDLCQKQDLLTADTAGERLSLLHALLDGETRRLETAIMQARASGRPFGGGFGISPN